MSAPIRMVNQNWWITTLLVGGYKHCPPLTQDIKCDVLIVGGGFSGVAAAAEFLKKGLKVVLIEKNIIGGSSSGRSAGFLTPDSELINWCAAMAPRPQGKYGMRLCGASNASSM